jgi:lipopolysaccharide export system protein LptC
MSANLSDLERIASPPRPRPLPTATGRLRRRQDPHDWRRRFAIAAAKRLLPLAGIVLLCALALWPELARQAQRARLAWRAGLAIPESGEVTQAVYHGVDEHGRPYTMTASRARQRTQDRVELVDPKGDITLQSGNWLLAQSRRGVYLQHETSLDLSRDVHLYRDDGTTLATETATIDLKQGAATSNDMVHAEGPFGTLDAQGFTLVDKGAAVQFPGPGRLVLNAAEKPAPPTQ